MGNAEATRGVRGAERSGGSVWRYWLVVWGRCWVGFAWRAEEKRGGGIGARGRILLYLILCAIYNKVWYGWCGWRCCRKRLPYNGRLGGSIQKKQYLCFQNTEIVTIYIGYNEALTIFYLCICALSAPVGHGV